MGCARFAGVFLGGTISEKVTDADNFDVLRDCDSHVLRSAEHNPPHFHAYYQETSAIVDIHRCEVISGNLPSKQTRLVLAWAELRREELLADWALASNGELPFGIEPLR